MIDRYGRTLTYLRVSLIDRCNLRCLYCMPSGGWDAFGRDELLSMEEITHVVRVFAGLGIQKVRLTGGEPLLRKDVPRLVSGLKAIPGIREVVMTTNAVLLERFAGPLKAAGLDRLNVSLDSLDRMNFRRITGMDKYREVLGGIEAAAREGLKPLKINTVLMKGYNDHEIMNLVRFCAERGFEIRFIEWMPTAGEVLDRRASRYLSVECAKKEIARHHDLVPDEPDPHAPARTFRLSGTGTRVGFISPLSNQFCGMCNRLRLKANGMLKTCLHGAEDLNIRSLLRARTDTDVIRQKIESVVYDRPREHHLNDPSVRHKDFVMTAVGG